MYSKYSLKFVFLSLFAGCTLAIIVSLLQQSLGGLQIDALGVLQRYLCVLCGLLALLGALHDSRGTMRRIYAGAILVTATLGSGIALLQIRLMTTPNAPLCGPALQDLMENLPFSHSLPMLFRAAGDCAGAAHPMLGLPLAEWALICFVLGMLLSLWQTLRRTPERRRFS